MPAINTVMATNDDAANWEHAIRTIAWPPPPSYGSGIGTGGDTTTTTTTNTFISAALGLAAGFQNAASLALPVAGTILGSILTGVAHRDITNPPKSLTSPPHFFFHGYSAELALAVSAVSKVARQPLAEAVTLFRALVGASGADRESLFIKIHETIPPEEIYEVAVLESASFGGEIRFALAASALAACGQKALGTLNMIARNQSPDAEYFVYSAANLKDCPVEKRAAIVAKFLKNPNADVKAQALDALEALSNEPRE